MADTRAIKRVAIVMAGGSGERFWPLSRQLRPKQLLCLSGGQKSLLAEAVARIAPLIPPEDVYIATARHLAEPIRAARVGVPDENVIAEPCKRNTAGCLAYATAHLLARYASADTPPESEALQNRLSVAVLTADQVIGDEDTFRATVDTALSAAYTEAALTTIGVVPTHPDTGYGYIQIPEDGTPLPAYSTGIAVYPVSAYHEKPNAERAQQFIDSDRFFWNSGMFFWTVSTFLSELEAATPELAQATLDMAQAMCAADEAGIEACFKQLDNVSIDIALMEKTRKVLVVRAEFPWDDVGTWPALDRTFDHDEAGNVVVGDPVTLDCRDCVVYVDRESGRDKAVAVLGAEDLIVVVTDDAVLVAPKERAQDIKRAVSALKERGARQV
ncbi:MAG: NTP transferase domain-containing protein [Nitrospiraceae bacterium]|nr:NTP transferase domain-containing protein [Nitrospiraceae bacterium]